MLGTVSEHDTVMENRCSLCEVELGTETDESRATGACADCREALGLVPMNEPRRPPAPCQRCNGMQFVRAIPREHSSGGGSPNTAAPMVVTHEIAITERFLRNKMKPVWHASRGAGMLELYICRRCGFVEWYCDAPQSLPIGPQYMTQLVDYTSDTPYR